MVPSFPVQGSSSEKHFPAGRIKTLQCLTERQVLVEFHCILKLLVCEVGSTQKATLSTGLLLVCGGAAEVPPEQGAGDPVLPWEERLLGGAAV